MDTYRRLIQYMKPYRGRLVLAGISMLLFSFFNSLVSVAVYVVTNGIFNQGRIVVKNLPFLEPGQTLQLPLYTVPVVLVVVFAFRGIFDFTGNYLMSTIGMRAVMQVRNDLYRKMATHSLDFFTRGRTGDMISRIMSDVGQIQGAISEVLVDLFKQPFSILFNIGLVFYWGGKLALTGVIIFPIVAVPIIFLGRRVKRITFQAQSRLGDITSILEETFNGIRVVKAFNMENAEISKFEAVNKRVFIYLRRILTLSVVQKPLVEIMGAFGVAGAIWFGMQQLEPDRFVAFITSMFILYEPVKKLSKVNSSIQQSVASGMRIFEIMDMENKIQDKPGAVVVQTPVNSIVFERVRFCYNPEKSVLNDIQLEINAGDVVAFVGPSGSGKTTLVNLLPRFYDPTEGRVLLNGKDLRDYQIKSLRDQIGLVTQEIVLFNGSIAENIAYGKPGAPQSEIERAARMAYAHDFIDILPEKYQTQIGEKGFMLSGGQRQRIAIARAILKDPPILILDEATSHLDTQSEREVQNALENLMTGKTVLMIAHRLSTIQKASRIIVLEHGEIVQSGSNQVLLGQEGIYKRLYELQ